MATPIRFGQQFGAHNQALQHFTEYAGKVNELTQLCARLIRINQQLSTLMATKGTTGSIGTTGSTGTTGLTGTTGSMMSQMQRMQEMNQSFNLQYLALQENMQNESRQFSLLSNIMKTKHDTAKNSISNLR